MSSHTQCTCRKSRKERCIYCNLNRFNYVFTEKIIIKCYACDRMSYYNRQCCECGSIVCSRCWEYCDGCGLGYCLSSVNPNITCIGKHFKRKC